MWPLEDRHFAYQLTNPTNFASVLEYRYCLDSTCELKEKNDMARYANGILDFVQLPMDQLLDLGP